MRLLLLLLLYPIISHPQCAPGDIGRSCAQIKSQQYHVNNEQVRPHWTHAIHGRREIRRSQSSDPVHTFEKPTVAFNMWRQPLYPPRLPQPVQRFPLHPLQPPRSFQISGAVQHQAILPKRSHGVRNLALNQDPIDSFERAVAGDEFDNRRPVEPIRVIKVESAEVLEPVVPLRGVGSDPRKTRKIIESLTRHMNEIRQPKVIPFPSKDEIVNSEIVSPSEVKITKVQTTQVTKEVGDVSSAEIANGIVDNILNGNGFAKNASTLLRVLTNLDQKTDANETDVSTTVSPDEEALQELTGPSANETDSTSLSAKRNEERIDVIGSEIDDYTDEDWDEFSDTGPKATRKSRPSSTPTAPTGAIVTTSPSSTSSVRTTVTTTTSKDTKPARTQNAVEQEIDLENLQDDFSDFEDNGSVEEEPATSTTTTITTTTTSRRRRTTLKTTTPPTTSAAPETEEEPIGAAAQTITEEEPEEADESSEEEEEATAGATTPAERATTTTSLREGFKAAIREQEREALRMRVREAKEEMEEEGETTVASKDITELNSMTLITIEKQKKRKVKLPKKLTEKEMEREREEEEKEEKLTTIEERRKRKEKRLKKLKEQQKEEEEGEEEEDQEKDIDLPKGIAEALRQSISGIGQGKDKKKGKKKSGKGKQIMEETDDDMSKSTDEATDDKIRDQINSVPKDDEEKNEEEEEIPEEENAEEAARKPKPKTKKKSRKEKEEEKEEEEEEPVGAGAQTVTKVPALRVETKEETIVTIRKPKSSKDKKANGKKEVVKKKMRTEDEEQLKEKEINVEKEEEKEEEAEVEEEVETVTEQPEESEVEEDVTESIPKKTRKEKAKKTDTKAKKEEEIEEEEENQITTAKAIEIGGERSNIRTDKITASLKDAPNAKYYYPPKIMVPLPSCFYNPSGYVCCNLQLNNLIEDTFEEIKNIQGYSACNIAKMANIIQEKSEKMFEHPFESIVALSDFAQNVHFAGDLVCKVEIDGKYMLTYATPYDADNAVESVVVAETPAPEDEEEEKEEKTKKKKEKILKKTEKKTLPIHNFRM